MGCSSEGSRKFGRTSTTEKSGFLSGSQELGIPVVVCNFAAPNFEELGRAREIVAIQVRAYFPEPA